MSVHYRSPLKGLLAYITALTQDLDQMTLQCPLCLFEKSECVLRTEAGLEYYLCPQCDLRFLDPKRHLNREDEKYRYVQHDNRADDPKYQDFVRPLYEIICARMPSRKTGLDFGSGASSSLKLMLESASYKVNQYDPNFWPDPTPLNEKYDFICACEVVEHLYQPGQEFQKLHSMLRPGGLLALMTLLYQPGSDFENWYYRRDPTHVVFYSAKTFRWLADHFQFRQVEILNDRVVVLNA